MIYECMWQVSLGLKEDELYTSMWQVSLGLKEDEMGSQGPQCHGGCQKFHFREFSVSCSQTSSCARKPLVLRHRCIVYTSMWQVSSRLKEDEMGSQTPHYVRGGCKKIIFDLSGSLAKKIIFDLSGSLAPKLALVPGSRLYCN